MLVLYRVFGVLYLLSGLWCVIELDAASKFLGFQFISSAGIVEFFSVYGGLQVGLGFAILITSLQHRYMEASLYFSTIFSTCLLLFRLLSFAIYGFVSDFIIMLIIEAFISVSLWWVWIKYKTKV